MEKAPPKKNLSTEYNKMEVSFLIFMFLIQYGDTIEILPVYAHGKDEIILQLPEHLNQTDIVEYVWKKENELIATIYGNGALRVSDPKYEGILSSSHDGSLIIKECKSWNVRDEYSVDIKLTDKSRSSIHYRVNSYIRRDTGPTFVHATVGENLILPLEYVLIEQGDIQEIDWLTERWIYFAATNVDGTIRILEDITDESLSSSPNGSLIFTKVTKDDEGIYRACILSRKGIILEQTYKIQISENYPFFGDCDGKTEWNILTYLSENKMIFFIACMVAYICIISGCILYLHMRRKERMKTMLDPKVTIKSSGAVMHLILKMSDSETKLNSALPVNGKIPPTVPLL